ncbi:hypothetical protein [Armatimonas sp.]|uniref:hypothetical protein n=1 Tax=Armatimonas sp. TaxID=1872638 RepID=UPI00286C2BF1|nr:hypothetical protein [Armatimonas sp.]
MKTDNDYLTSPLGALAQVKLRLTQGAPELQPALRALTERVGVDLWNYQAPGGGSIRKALDFIPLLGQAAVAYKEPSYEQVLSGIPASRSAQVQLLHPRKETKRL